MILKKDHDEPKIEQNCFFFATGLNIFLWSSSQPFFGKHKQQRRWNFIFSNSLDKMCASEISLVHSTCKILDSREWCT